MDIRCPSCGEPYDHNHMRFDEPHEWGLGEFTRQSFIDRGSRFEGPDDPVRKAAEATGWRFASNSVLSFTRCPSCRTSSVLADAVERRAKVAAAAMLNGDDDDGFVADISED